MRFTLASLLLAFVVVAQSLAVFGAGGLIAAPIALAIAAYIRSAKSMAAATVKVGLVGVGGGMLLAILLLPRPGSGPTARSAVCANNLRQIDVATRGYEMAKGELPPVQVRDKDGKPLYGWRVLVLPYLEYARLFASFDLEEPWNGVNNGKLAQYVPNVYCCPLDFSARKQELTSYAAVVGPDGNWLVSQPRASFAVKDKGPNPVLVIEATGAKIPWSEPRDISLDDACGEVLHDSGPGISSKHVFSGNSFFCDEFSGANVLFADGTILFVRPDTPPDLLRAALLGDRAAQAELEQRPYERVRRVHWLNCAALAGLLISLAVLIYRPRRPEPSDAFAKSAA